MREARIGGVDGRATFEVPIEQCTTGYLFSYSEAGWHPLVKALEFAGDGPQVVEEFLTSFYGSFQPGDLAELFSAGSHPPPEHVPRWPLVPEIVRGVWNVNPWWLRWRLAMAEASPGAEAPVSVYLGPQSDDAVATEAKRLLDLHDSIAHQGYVPAARGHRIAGYFLVKGDDYRFVLSSGNHRVAVLKALGYRTCIATFMPGLPYAVNHEQVFRWSTLAGGVYEPETAEWLFTRFFEHDGRQVATWLAMD